MVKSEKQGDFTRSLEDKGYVESTTRPFVTARQHGGFTRRAHKWVRATTAGLQLGERLWEVRPWEWTVHCISVADLAANQRARENLAPESAVFAVFGTEVY